jgi:hypothetical protein
MKRLISLALVLVLALAASACGDDDTDVATPGNTGGDDVPSGSVGDPDQDPDVEPVDGGDEFPTDQAREDARGYLGMNEGDLPDEVRIRRRGDEQFMLTEDYVLGRVTVELDDTDGSGYRVTSLVVELPDGPETFELEPG